MHSIAFIQYEYSVKDIMKALGILDLQAPALNFKFIDIVEPFDEIPSDN